MLATLKVLPMLFSPSFWKKMFREFNLVWQLMKDGRTPLYLKILPVIVGVYLLSPIDLIPGFLPIVGQLDDFGLLLMALSLFIRLAPKEIVADYLPAANVSAAKQIDTFLEKK